MRTAVVFSAIFAVAVAQSFPPLDLESSCASILCLEGSSCVEETIDGLTRARCVNQSVPVGDKPGDCPVLYGGQFGICASNCQLDGDCEGSDKCCRNPCDSTTCQAPEFKPSCDTVKCGQGQQCVLQDVVCVRDPCYPQPVCVDVKPGECPVPGPQEVGICANTCSSDSECKGNDRCCKNACGATTCQRPQGLVPDPVRPSCETVMCGQGQQCVLQDVVCVRAPCYPQPVCVDVKPGECPVPGPQELGICASTCSSDSECKGNDKCCENACGATTCQRPQGLVPDPVRPSCETVRCRSGQRCVMKQVQCVRGPCYPQPMCVDVVQPVGPTCATVMCRSGQRCVMKQVQCFRAPCYPQPMCVDVIKPVEPSCDTVRCGPGEVCVMRDVQCIRHPCPSPLPQCVPREKPGVCPKPSFSFSFHMSFFSCRSQCRSDAHCPGSLKCCKTRCGARCQQPELRPSLTCDTVDCLPDHTCVMNKECDELGCFPRPVCEPIKRCPFYPMWINPFCVPQNTCSENNPQDCPPGTMCCSTDCGKKCVRPLE